MEQSDRDFKRRERKRLKKMQEEEHKSEGEMLAYCRSNGLTMGFGVSWNSMSQDGVKSRKEEGLKSPTVSAKYKNLFKEEGRRKNKTDRLDAIRSNSLHDIGKIVRRKSVVKKFHSSEEAIKKD